MIWVSRATRFATLRSTAMLGPSPNHHMISGPSRTFSPQTWRVCVSRKSRSRGRRCRPPCSSLLVAPPPLLASRAFRSDAPPRLVLGAPHQPLAGQSRRGPHPLRSLRAEVAPLRASSAAAAPKGGRQPPTGRPREIARRAAACPAWSWPCASARSQQTACSRPAYAAARPLSRSRPVSPRPGSTSTWSLGRTRRRRRCMPRWARRSCARRCKASTPQYLPVRLGHQTLTPWRRASSPPHLRTSSPSHLLTLAPPGGLQMVRRARARHTQ